MIKPNPQNKRGDKNVINGAKKTMKYVIRGSLNGKTKWQKVNQILLENNIKNNAQAVTWMFLALLTFNQLTQCKQILRHYIDRMDRKVEKGNSHQNQEYNERKRNRQVKFIDSAKLLLEKTNKQSIIASAISLFEYDSCSRKAVEKLKHYLQQNPIEFESQTGDIETKPQNPLQSIDHLLSLGDSFGQKVEASTGSLDSQVQEKFMQNKNTQNVFAMQEKQDDWECYISDDWEEMEI